MNSQTSTTYHINWGQIFSLAFLDGVIVLSWIVYHSFQPKLIHRFHFDHLGGFVHATQAIVMILVPLLAGLAADYWRRTRGSMFNVFAIGISIASMLFMSVSFTISDQAYVNLVWLLPVMIVFWIISMNIFHSPANSILENFAHNPALPVIMAVIAIVKILIHAFEHPILEFSEKQGGALTFAAGGSMLIIAGFLFWLNTRKMEIHEHHDSSAKSNFIPVIILGLLTGLCSSLLLHKFPEVLSTLSGNIISSIRGESRIPFVLAAAALCSLPAAFFVRKLGIKECLYFSILFLILFMFPLVLFDIQVISLTCIAGIAISYAFMNITAFPFALINITPANATFGTGLFFACFELPEIIFSYLH